MGQEHVVKALANALSSDRLHHAYLFTGTRGVGKTTVARVFAKCLNCETGVVSEPCGECSACQEITEGRFVDLIEIDAASRTRVEDMRELLDNVQYRPTRARYKVYLIDEVHMLSNSSFNALLKTLEEPPDHVKFLLATTDPQKLPVTVLSRCLQFNLKMLSSDRIARHLQEVLARESVSADAQALREIAHAAAGSMRDALSLTDQAIAYTGGNLTGTDVANMLGTVDRQKVWSLVDGLLHEDRQRVLSESRALSDFSPDYEEVLQRLAEAFYAIALAQTVPEAATELEVDPALFDELVRRQPPAAIQLLYQIALLSRRDLSLAPDPRIGFEMALLRMLALQPVAGGLPPQGKPQSPPRDSSPGSELPASRPVEQTRLTPPASGNIPHPVEKPGPVESIPTEPESAEPAPVEPESAEQSPAQTLEKTPEAPALEMPESTSLSVDASARDQDLFWERLLQELKASGILRAILLHTELVHHEPGRIELRVDNSQQGILNKDHPEKVRKLLEASSGSAWVVEMGLGEIKGETPAMLMQRRKALRQAAAEEAIHSDPNVQWIQSQLAGSLVEQSIRPAEKEDSGQSSGRNGDKA